MRSNGSRERFTPKRFVNPRTGTESWRVDGYRRDGSRVRENFTEEKAAQCRSVELKMEWLARESDTAIRATKLTESQLRIAETAFLRLDSDHELLLAVEHWRKTGRQATAAESPRLDDAFEQFGEWLKTGSGLRPLSERNLRLRVGVFVNSTDNLRVSEVTAETIDGYLAHRRVSARSKDNDRRAVSRFFSWCAERPRRWAVVNPCREVIVQKPTPGPPAILTVEECEKLLAAAEAHKEGKLAPYVAVCLFAGLRPFEASRLSWGQVNLEDGEIRLEAGQTKTDRPRVLAICPTLKAWLEVFKGVPFGCQNWRRDFDEIKLAAGFGTPTKESPKLKPWPVDVLRHTAISHYFRQTGSYGRTAEHFGNSESIIKNHYQGRVTTEETARFYVILPAKGMQ